MKRSVHTAKKIILVKLQNSSHHTPNQLPRLMKMPKSGTVAQIKVRPPRPERNPGDPLFRGAVKPSFILVNYPDYLTDREQSEIQLYKEIYYLRNEPPKSKKTSNVIPNFFHFVQNEHIAFRYEQEEVIGKGAFGSVLKCLDHKTGECVAIKMLRDKPKVHSQIMFELDLLMQLQDREAPNGHNIIRYVENFTFRGFFCIVMELLYLDLYTVLKMQRFVGFKMPVVQTVAKETAEALHFMHSHGIIHCDIKPENIIFVTAKQDHVKVIDFGCSCYVGKLLFSYIQSRYYRAPEVVLGMEYSKEIDIWSLGCVLCEMVTGYPLFPANDEAELISMMVEMRGLPPHSMIKNAPRAHHYFDPSGQLKSQPSQSGKLYIPNAKTIQQATKIRDGLLLSLIEGCLTWVPSERITAQEILDHPWIHQMMPREPTVPKSART